MRLSISFNRFCCCFSLFAITSPAAHSQKRYGLNDFYFTMSMSAGNLFYPPSQGNLNVGFPYVSTTPGGAPASHRFESELPITYSNAKGKSAGTNASIELGDYRYFLNGRIGGNYYATSFSLSAGVNIYFPIQCKQSKPMCLVIKPSIGLGITQSFPFNRLGAGHNHLGKIDNDNTTIKALGYRFDPTYQTGGPASTTTVDAKWLDVFYFENNTTLIPRLSIGKNNFERIFYWDIEFAYYFNMNQRRGLQLFQDGDKSKKTVWLDKNGVDTYYNNGPIAGTPSIFSGAYVGITVGLNFSSEVFQSYGVDDLKKHTADFGRVCHCEDHNKVIRVERSRPKKSFHPKNGPGVKSRSKTKKKSTGKPTKKEDNTRGW